MGIVKEFFFPYLRFHRFDFSWKETSGREREIGRKKVRDPIIAGRGRIKIRDNLIFKHRDDPNIDRHGSVEAKHGIMSGGELFSTELYRLYENIIVYRCNIIDHKGNGTKAPRMDNVEKI